MKRTATLLLATAVAPLLSVVVAQTTCNVTNLCGSEAPCCSEYGFCSTNCRGGCDPIKSYTPESCEPMPLCASKTYTFTDLSRITNGTTFNNNVTAYDWTVDNASDGDINLHVGISEDNLALYLTQSNGGTRVSSTRYVHYGTITTTMKVGHWNGVVVTFIGMSDAHDEIDWEWPGSSSSDQGQSNYFWLGVIDGKAAGFHNMSSDGFANYHDYTIDWQEDQLEWKIDNETVRTLKKSDTLDSATGTYKYPMSPMRIELSIWPAGVSTETQGVIDWAGGLIDWTDSEYVAAGHFYSLIQQVSVSCDVSGDLAPPADAVSYIYGANSSNNPSVAYSNESAMSAAPGTYTSGLRTLVPLFAAGAVAVAALVL